MEHDLPKNEVGLMKPIKKETIDLEPTWSDVCSMLKTGHIKHEDADLLLPACEIADTVRQAQKKGKKRVIFEFVDDKKTQVKIE